MNSLHNKDDCSFCPKKTKNEYYEVESTGWILCKKCKNTYINFLGREYRKKESVKNGSRNSFRFFMQI